MAEERETLKQVLMRRDGLSSEAAEDLIQSAREELYDLLAVGETVDDSDFMMEWFGLEGDFIEDVLN